MTSAPLPPVAPDPAAPPLEGTIADIAGFLVPRMGDLCVVTALEPDGTLRPVEIAASDPAEADLMRRNLLRHPLHISQTGRLAARVAASGTAVFVPDADGDYAARHTLDDEHRALVAGYRPRSIMIVPLTADGRVLGTVALTSNSRRFEPENLRLLEEFAGRMALLLDSAEARRRATRSLDLLQRLQRLTGPLLGATTPDEVVDLIVPELVTAVGAIGGGVLLPDAGEQYLETKRVAGDYDGEYLSRFLRVPLAETLAAGPGSSHWYPAHDAWRTGSSVLIACLADWLATYRMAPRLLGPGGDASWAVLPMRGRERMVGLVTLVFPSPGPIAPDQLAFMEAAANQCAVALERIAAERALAERDTRLSTLVRQAPLGVVWADLEGGIRGANPAFCALAGRSESALGALHMSDVTHPDDIAPSRAALQTVLDRGEPVTLEKRYRQPDGTDVWASTTISPLRGPDGALTGTIVLVDDLRERRAAEERLRETARLEAIGQLAGGLAHEFRNQLQAILGFAGYVARDPGLGEESREDLRQVKRASDRLTTLTSQLLAFSRRQVLAPTTLDLNAALADTLPMLRQLIGSNNRMTTQLSQGPLWVRADRVQLQQVVTNLVVNARDAMPEGGELLIRSERRMLPDGTSLGADVPAGRYVILTVQDTGVGIPPERLPHIFEPFFTTKEVGQGTGLGLASVHGIVTQSGGFVTGESEVGAGTRMTVFLPEVEQPATGEPLAGAPGGEPAAADRAAPAASILVVEDDDVVRRLLVRILEDAGYRTLTAANGRLALSVLEANRGGVDLILSDVVMPETRPSELAQAYTTRFNHAPVLWMSGFPADTALPERWAVDPGHFIQKPVDADLLLARVGELLRMRKVRA